MKTISVKQALTLLLCAAALAYSMVQVLAVGDHLQYAFPAPAPVSPAGTDTEAKPNQAIADLCDALKDQAGEWADTMRLWTVNGAVERATFTSVDANRLTATGRLTLYGRYGQDLQEQVLRFGRWIYPEELTGGAQVVILDEPLALALFRVGDPIDRLVRIGEKEYRVIGVVSHAKRVGPSTDYGAYIPLTSVTDTSLALDYLWVEAEPRKGVGASVSFRSVTENWHSGGTLIDLNKERVGAWLWLRVLGFAAGMLAVLRIIRRLNGAVRFFLRTCRQRLQSAYAVRLAPWMTMRIAGFAAAYAGCVAALALLMSFILAPMTVFPEWIPSVLVEWQDIGTTFWKVWQGFAASREIRTPELIRLRFFTLVVDGFSALAGVVLAMIYARLGSAAERAAQGLRALYRQGAVFTELETTTPLRFVEQGYMTVEEKAGAVKMRRVVNAQKALELLPAAVDGSFVVDMMDAQVPENNVRLRVVCQGGRVTARETGRPWDLQLSPEAMTRLLSGTEDFKTFTETATGFDLQMRSPAMDGLFRKRSER